MMTGIGRRALRVTAAQWRPPLSISRVYPPCAPLPLTPGRAPRSTRLVAEAALTGPTRRGRGQCCAWSVAGKGPSAGPAVVAELVERGRRGPGRRRLDQPVIQTGVLCGRR